MNRFRLVLVLSFVSLFVVLPSTSQNVQLSVSAQSAIAVRLESLNSHEAEEGLYDLLEQIGDAELKNVASNQVKAALTTALRNEIERSERIKAGETFESPSEEYLFRLSEAVISLQDPESIPLLMNVAHMGNTPQSGLLEFGPSIIPYLVEYATTSDLTDSQASGVLSMFSAALREWGEFNPDVRAQVKQITVKYLSLPSDYTYPVDDPDSAYLYAMFLASDLGDSDLREMVVDIIPIVQRFSDRMGLSHLNWDL